MPKASPAISSFVSGELSPTLEGRTDLAIYGTGCYKLENLIPMTQGPARRRSGTRFINHVKDSNARTWLSRFVYNVTDSYILEWGDHYLRFFTDHGAVLEAPFTISNATATNAVVITAEQNFVNGDEVFITEVGSDPIAKKKLLHFGGAMTQINGRFFIVANRTATTFELAGIDGTGWGTYISGATVARVYQIVTPYGTLDLVDENGLFALSMVQSADVIYIAHGAFPPNKLSRFGPLNWTLIPFEIKGGPFKTANEDKELTIVTSSGDWHKDDIVTVTASSGIFLPGHVGALFYIEQSSIRDIRPWEAEKVISALNAPRRYNGVVYRATEINSDDEKTGDTPPTHLEGEAWDQGGIKGVRWLYINAGFGWLQITGVTSPTEIVGVVRQALPTKANATPETSHKWAFGAWSDVEGWPHKVTFFKERLVFARRGQVWASVSGDFEVFTARDEGGLVKTDMAISITVPTQEKMQWMEQLGDLILGTSGGEVVVGPTNLAQPLGPENIQTRPTLAHGSRNVRPARVKDSILFVQVSGRKLRELRGASDAYSANYAADDLTTRAEHITRGGIISQAFQQEPDSVLWCVLGQESE